MHENGMMPAVMDQGGNVNLFGNVTIVHTQQFGQRNPMMDQMNAMMRLQSQAMQRQALALEQQKLMLEAKKIDVIDRLTNGQALPQGSNITDGLRLANTEPAALLNDVAKEIEDIEDVEYEVHADNDVEKSVINPIKIKIGDKIIEENKNSTNSNHMTESMWEIKEDATIYDFSPNADYINLSKFFDEKGNILQSIRNEIDDSSLNKIKIRCDNPGAPAIVFLKYHNKTNTSSVNLMNFWRNSLGFIISRYSKSVFKNPNINSSTEFVVFITDDDYEFMYIVNIRPVSNLNTFVKISAKEQIKGYRAAKSFMNWIEDNNSLIENKRIKSVLVVAEPIIPDDKRSLEFSPDNLLTSIQFTSVFDNTKDFRIDMTEYAKKIYEVYNIHK